MRIAGISAYKNKRVERGLCTEISHTKPFQIVDTNENEKIPFARLYPATVSYPLTISRLKRIVKKRDVVSDIFKNISEGEDGNWDYEVGVNTEKNSQTMEKFRLIIRDGKIKLVVNELRVIEFY